MEHSQEQSQECRVEELKQALEQKTEEIRKIQEQLVLQEKMASLGTLTAGIVHEIKNHP